MYIVYEINLCQNDLDSKFTLSNSLFSSVKLTKNPDPDQYSYSGYGIRFNVGGTFSISNGSGFRKNVIMS